MLDESTNTCVYPEDCPCPPCDPLPANCSKIVTLSNQTCNCSVCRGIKLDIYIDLYHLFSDCSIEGQTYQERNDCPATCKNPHPICASNSYIGCSCPRGQVFDGTNDRCVDIKNCPSNVI